MKSSAASLSALRPASGRAIGSIPLRWLVVLAILVVVSVVSHIARGQPPSDQIERIRTNSASGASSVLTLGPNAGTSIPPTSMPPTEQRIKRFCGDCHAVPRPESFTKDVWYDEIRLGYEFYARSGRTDLDPPPLEEVLKYYREHAPQTISFPKTNEVDRPWAERFRAEKIDWQDKQYVQAGVASVQWLPVFDPTRKELVVCDIHDGSVSMLDPAAAGTPRRLIARLQNPCRVVQSDIDADGFQDLLVADLGSSLPFDHQLGRVVLLRRVPGQEAFAEIVVGRGYGRIADVQAVDLTDRGQPDILFAEFGHRERGGIHAITNLAEPGQVPKLQSKRLDQRPGTIQLPTHDWDGDGRMDITALVSQEYESIEIYLNRGDRFERNLIWQGPDLTFGSVGIQLTDLDDDSDMDILYVNGDAFDNTYANASHGVQWLENLGNMRFAYHRLADLTCAYRAVASDIDRDGDKDILVVVNMPRNVKPLELRSANVPAIVLLEQTSRMHFETRVLDRGVASYPALEVGDFNQDGLIDFVVGSLQQGEIQPSQALPRLTIYWGKRQ